MGRYLDVWQLLDLTRIALQLTYVIKVRYGKIPGVDTSEEHLKQMNIIYGYLSFVSWISVLGYMRIFRGFRIFVDSVIAIFYNKQVN